VSTPAERLRGRIAARGAIPFADFMDEALYGAGGYYRRDEPPIGIRGDFVTGSTLSPLFGRATARLVRRLDAALGAPADLLEVGCGEGAHLAAVLAALGGGAERRVWGRDRVARPLPAGVARLDTLADLPAGGVRGLIFSYELFDALPVHRLVGRAGLAPGELWVELDERGDFRWREGDLSRPDLAAALAAAGVELAPGQIADFSPQWAPLYRELVARLGAGLLVTCDYGFETAQLYDRRVRFHGTLAAHRRHRVHRDALRDAGEQDLTAHVDFALLRRAGEEAGLVTRAFTRQAAWLAAGGIFEDLREADLATRQSAAQLLDGEGMGEAIRVLVQARGAGATVDLGLEESARPRIRDS
jgi:SAM-dependent MidA family methyltransferase